MTVSKEFMKRITVYTEKESMCSIRNTKLECNSIIGLARALHQNGRKVEILVIIILTYFLITIGTVNQSVKHL